MRTVSETDVFVRYAAQIWSGEERLEFINFIALATSSRELVAVERSAGPVPVLVNGGGARVIYFLPNEDVV